MTFPLTHDNGVVELDPADPRATVCGWCHRGWDDSVPTGLTPVPSARCPFEYEHTIVDMYDDVPNRAAGIHFLTHDKQTGVYCGGDACFSKYGSKSADCAPVAWRLAYLIARETGESMTYDNLDHAMGLVVNEHEDVAYMIRTYGRRKYT